MPKKKKSSEKDEKILAEIAATLKKIPARKEESELEEDMVSEEDAQSFDDALAGMDFHQFMKVPTEGSGAPVLERVALEAPRPIFVSQFQGGSRAQQTEADENAKNDGFKYIGGGEGKNEAKYVESSSQIYKEPESFDLAEAGRRQTPVGQETFFRQSAEAGFGADERNKAWRVDRFEVEKAGRNNPMGRDKDDMKYEKYKPSHSK